MNFPGNPVTSPELDTNSGIVKTQKQFSDGLTLELTDDEIERALALSVQIVNKYSRRYATPEVFDEIDDEVSYRFAELGILAKYDRVENFIDIIGKAPWTDSAKYGHDHDKKGYQVKKARERNEDFLGQKESPDSTKSKKRYRSQ